MRDSATKICFLRAGIYHFGIGEPSDCDGPAMLWLDARDSGETWSVYPPDGYGSAVLDGGSTSPSSGLYNGICINGTSGGVVIDGLQIQRIIHTQIQIYDPNVIIRNNTLHNYTEHSNNGAVNVGGRAATGAQILNNYIYDVAERGINAGPCFSSDCAGGISNLTIANNYIFGTCVEEPDCGAIYIVDFQFTRSANITITNNYIRDTPRGIYLDDGTSNAMVTGNIVVGAPVCFNVHGGANNVYRGNICDETTNTTTDILRYQNSDPYPSGGGDNGGGNAFIGNIIVSVPPNAGTGYDGDAAPGVPPLIADNFYQTPTASSGVFADYSPIVGDPQISGWTYRIAPTSPALSAPVNFVAPPGNWGPPGFVVPQSGTAPSD